MIDAVEREYWRKFYAGELPQWHCEHLKKINEQWVLKTPFGPMVHKETSKTYWETQVDMERTNEAHV